MVNRKFLLRCWAIAKPYWVSPEKFGAGSLLMLSWGAIFAFSTLNVALNRQSGNMISALAAQSREKLVPAVLTFLGVLLVYIPVAAAKEYLPKQLALYWRRWMTRRFLGEYFSDRSYYNISGNSQIDNPDQRIAQDIDTFTTESLTVLTVVLDTISGLMATSVAIWLISKELFVVVLIYGILGNLIGFGFFGRRLTRLNFLKFKKEADFRFGLIRIGENAG